MERFSKVSLVAASLMLVLATAPVLAKKEVHADDPLPGLIQAIPTRDVDNPARQPFFFSCDAFFTDPIRESNRCFFSVPTGKRLVIENFSATMQSQVGQNIMGKLYVVAPGGVAPISLPSFLAYYPAQLLLSFPTDKYYAVNQPVRVYADSTGLSPAVE